MPRKKSTQFRASFEQLERRDLMTANLASNYRPTDYLASTLASVQTSVVETELPTAVNGASASSYSFSRLITLSSYVKTTGPVNQAVNVSTTTVAKPVVSVTPAPNVTVPAAPVVAAPDWFDLNISDAMLRAIVRQNVANDKLINRNEMLGIFSQVGKDGVVSAAEFNDLKKVIGTTSYFVGLDYVNVLASDVVNGNAANARFQGGSLGNLVAGSSSTQLNKLVDKWFYGKDHPTVTPGYGMTYQVAAGSLFPRAPSYVDVKQGVLGDCYFLSSLSEATVIDPKLITNMFIINGDGTYTVRFYNNAKPEYVTVDSYLPATAGGTYLYANLGGSIRNASTSLWVAMAEKAYAQMNESGWLRSMMGEKGANSYDALSGGYMFLAIAQITGKRTAFHSLDQNLLNTLVNSHQLVTFGSLARPADKSIVAGHAYALLSYNAATGQIKLFNPWGVNSTSAPGIVTLSFAQLKANFSDMEYSLA